MNKRLTFDTASRGSVTSDSQTLLYDPVDVLELFRRWWHVVGLTAFAALIISILYVQSLTPRYQAHSQLLLGEQSLSSSSDFNIGDTQNLSSSVIEGELAVLQSSAVLYRVAERLELKDDPEFNGSLRAGTASPSLSSRLKDILRGFFPSSPEQSSPGTESAVSKVAEAAGRFDESTGELGPIIASLRSRVGVRQLGSSFVVAVSATSESPQKSAAIANTIMDEYIAFLGDKRFQAAQRFSEWLETRVDELASNLEISEKQALAFKAKIEANAESNARVEQQMTELTSKLVAARASLAEAEAQALKLIQIRERDGVLAAADTIESPAMSALQGDLSELRRQEANAAVDFGEDSPQVASILRARAKMEEAVSAEVDRRVQQLNNSAEVQGNIVEALQSTLRDFEGIILSRSNEQIRLNQLQRNVEANARVYDEFLARFKEVSEIKNLQSSDAEVISYASPPSSPDYPRKKVTVILGAVAGLAGGIALAFLADFLLPKRVRSPSEVVSRTGVPVFGRIPRLNTRFGAQLLGREQRTIADEISELENDELSLIASIDLTNSLGLLAENKHNSVLITGEREQDNWRAALLLAHGAHRRGKSSIIVDCDTRNAGFSRLVEFDRMHDLTALLQGTSSLKEVVRKIEGTNISVLPTKTTSSDPVLLFSTERANQMYSDLRSQHFLTIYLTPSLSSESELTVFQEEADLAIVCVSSGHTTFKKMNELVDLARKLNAANIAAIVSRVPRKKMIA